MMSRRVIEVLTLCVITGVVAPFVYHGIFDSVPTAFDYGVVRFFWLVLDSCLYHVRRDGSRASVVPGSSGYSCCGASELSHLFSDCAIRNMVSIRPEEIWRRRVISRSGNLPKNAIWIPYSRRSPKTAQGRGCVKTMVVARRDDDSGGPDSSMGSYRWILGG
jgi:hypothetical protein